MSMTKKVTPAEYRARMKRYGVGPKHRRSTPVAALAIGEAPLSRVAAAKDRVCKCGFTVCSKRGPCEPMKLKDKGWFSVSLMLTSTAEWSHDAVEWVLPRVADHGAPRLSRGETVMALKKAAHITPGYRYEVLATRPCDFRPSGDSHIEIENDRRERCLVPVDWFAKATKRGRHDARPGDYVRVKDGYSVPGLFDGVLYRIHGHDPLPGLEGEVVIEDQANFAMKRCPLEWFEVVHAEGP